MRLTSTSRWFLAVPRTGAALSLAAALLLAGPAAAQDNPDLRALSQKLDRLQTELNTLQRAVYRDEPPAPSASGNGDGGRVKPGVSVLTQSAAARLQTRMGQMEREIQNLTGQIEETRFDLRKLGKRVDKLVDDVDYRLRQIETRLDGGEGAQAQAQTQDDGGAQPSSDTGQNAGGGAAGQDGTSGEEAEAAQATGSGDGSRSLGQVSADAVEELRRKQAGQQQEQAREQRPSADATQTAKRQAAAGPLPDAPPREQYDHAFGLLRQADYGAAEQALAAFVEAHPEHELAGNAKYWLGETYYVRNNYEQAAVTFAEGFRTYPDSGKAPANLLKLGMSLARIDRKEDACGIFAELLARYPDSARNVRQRAEREQERLSCGE